MKNAKGLTKNPLGIIGLFISLIYGFACLVLSTSISNLESSAERLPLIWFIIVFPLIILGTFLYLVVNHHEKLYAPSDFRNDDAFIETMSGKRIKEKQEIEAQILNSADESTAEEPLKPEKQVQTEKQNVTEMVTEDEDLKVRISNAEKWAIKELELKYNIGFKTNQRLTSGGITLELDAYASDSNRVFIAEVKYWQSHKAVKPLLLSLQEFVLKTDRFQRAFGKKDVKLAFVIVFDEINKSSSDRIKSFIGELSKDVSVEIKQYSHLKNDYHE